MRPLFLTLFFLSATIVVAQEYPEVSIPGSETRTMTSAIVDGQEYELQIQLPAGYEDSDKNYPVVYLMDSQWDFPLVGAIYGQQFYDGFIPELIIVGVTWANREVLRTRDYTPSVNGNKAEGADKFLDFMEKELFPFVEKNYRVDPSNRTLMGCSLGGLLTMYTLFTRPEMFSGYVAASPALGWNNGGLLKLEEEFSKKTINKPLSVYMTVGDVEMGRSFFESFAKNIENHHDDNLRFHAKVLENTGHSGTKSETYTRGLQFVFERHKLKLDDTVLNTFVGSYQADSGGTTIEIVNENNALYLKAGPQTKIALWADSPQHFYATFQSFNLYFQENEGHVVGFDLKTYESLQHFKKVK